MLPVSKADICKHVVHLCVRATSRNCLYLGFHPTVCFEQPMPKQCDRGHLTKLLLHAVRPVLLHCQAASVPSQSCVQSKLNLLLFCPESQDFVMLGMFRHCWLSGQDVCAKGVQHREGQILCSHSSASCPALREGFSKSQHKPEDR